MRTRGKYARLVLAMYCGRIAVYWGRWQQTLFHSRFVFLGLAFILSLLCKSNSADATEDVVENLVWSSNTTLTCRGTRINNLNLS